MYILVLNTILKSKGIGKKSDDRWGGEGRTGSVSVIVMCSVS